MLRIDVKVVPADSKLLFECYAPRRNGVKFTGYSGSAFATITYQ